MILAWVVGLAQAVPVLGGAVGWESPVGQPWIGVEGALWADQVEGWAPVGRALVAVGARGPQPLAVVELGALRVVPAEGGRVRVGAAARLGFGGAEFAFPLPVRAPSEGKGGLGFYPAGLAMLEFEWGEVAPFSLGVRAGPGSALASNWCVGEPTPACLTWHLGLVGGIYARKRFEGGLVIEAVGGSTASLLVGRAF